VLLTINVGALLRDSNVGGLESVLACSLYPTGTPPVGPRATGCRGGKQVRKSHHTF